MIISAYGIATAANVNFWKAYLYSEDRKAQHMLQSREPVGERRRIERFDLGLPVSFEYEFGVELQEERGRFINVSAGGAFLPCKNLVSPGTEFQLRIDAPSRRLTRPRDEGDRESSPPLRIRARGEVIRIERDPEVPESCFVAVEFTSPLRILRTSGSRPSRD